MIVELNDTNFDSEVLESSKPVLVDFWGDWCRPCKIVAPIVEEIASEYNERIKVGKVNVGQYPQIASQYEVLNIPTFIIFKNGMMMSKLVGSVTKDKLVDFINSNI